MTARMDLALDDIIQNNERYNQRYTRGRGRGRGGGFQKGTGGAFRRMRTQQNKTTPYRKIKRQDDRNPDDDSIWEHDLYEEEEEVEQQDTRPMRQERTTSIETGTKVAISNLEYSVTEENLKELFQVVGSVKRVTVNYDRSGRSEGTAEVVFNSRTEAQAALRKYNGVAVDGKAIRLTIVGTNLSASGGSSGVTERRTRGRGGFQSRGRRGNFTIQSSSRGGPRRVRIGGNRGFRRGRGRY